MPYATVSDVRALAPHVLINNTSTPSEGMVGAWITDQERIMDALFGSMGYTVPLTGTVSRTIAKELVTHFVMARILRSRPNPETAPAEFQSVYDGIMKRLRDPQDPFDLTDADSSIVAVLKASPHRFSSNLIDLLQEDDRPRINRDQVF